MLGSDFDGVPGQRMRMLRSARKIGQKLISRLRVCLSLENPIRVYVLGNIDAASTSTQNAHLHEAAGRTAWSTLKHESWKFLSPLWLVDGQVQKLALGSYVSI
jgi:hypothetical protein